MTCACGTINVWPGEVGGEKHTGSPVTAQVLGIDDEVGG